MKKLRLFVNTIGQFTNARSIHRSFYKWKRLMTIQTSLFRYWHLIPNFFIPHLTIFVWCKTLLPNTLLDGAESLKSSYGMGDGRILPLSLIMTYRMSLISAESISLDTSFKTSKYMNWFLCTTILLTSPAAVQYTETEFLEVIGSKYLRVFLLLFTVTSTNGFDLPEAFLMHFIWRSWFLKCSEKGVFGLVRGEGEQVCGSEYLINT